jgi:hypothetical protein
MTEDGRSNWLHVYAQDDWRLRDNLTVNCEFGQGRRARSTPRDRVLTVSSFV